MSKQRAARREERIIELCWQDSDSAGRVFWNAINSTRPAFGGNAFRWKCGTDEWTDTPRETRDDNNARHARPRNRERAGRPKKARDRCPTDAQQRENISAPESQRGSLTFVLTTYRR